jgi:hypothetical protein
MVSIVKIALVFFVMSFPWDEFGLGELKCFVKLFCRACFVVMRRVQDNAWPSWGVEAASHILDNDDLYQTYPYVIVESYFMSATFVSPDSSTSPSLLVGTAMLPSRCLGDNISWHYYVGGDNSSICRRRLPLKCCYSVSYNYYLRVKIQFWPAGFGGDGIFDVFS